MRDFTLEIRYAVFDNAGNGYRSITSRFGVDFKTAPFLPAKLAVKLRPIINDMILECIAELEGELAKNDVLAKFFSLLERVDDVRFNALMQMLRMGMYKKDGAIKGAESEAGNE
jgi:hypothetical protein